MKFIFIALAMLWLTACQSPAIKSSEWFNVCGSLDGAAWCYHEVGTPDLSKPAIIFNHGLNDDEQVFIKPTSVPSSYPTLIASMPHGSRILVISFGKAFMLTGYPGRTLKPVGATLENYKAILAKLSVKFKLMPPFALAGHSQGGNQVAMLWATYPELWSSATMINPALITDSTDPWNVFSICPWCLMVKYNYDNKDQWNAGRPSEILKQSGKLGPLAVTGCSQDVLFHLYAGTQEYADQAKAHAVSVDYHDGLPGCSHWLFDVPWVIKSLK